MDYFKHPEKIGETTHFLQCAEYVFEDIYDQKNHNRNLMKKMTNYNSLDQQPFLNKFLEYIRSPKTLEGEMTKCDYVFCEYLLRVSKLTKKEFYCKILKFVILFRECLNIFYADKAKTLVFCIVRNIMLKMPLIFRMNL